ncbi:MAG: glycosyltransferase family 2 protein [Candidatus Limnocylindria bacterium]
MRSRTVTALVVTYNHARYVAEAVRSAIDQGPELLEVLVVDDGSTDGTVDRVRALGEPRVRVISGGRRGLEGLSETYNTGLHAARGEYIAILEGDDRWPAGKLAAQTRAFDDPEVVVAHGDYAVIGARGTTLRERVRMPVAPGTYDALPAHLLGSYVMSVTAVIRRSALLACGGFRQLAGTPHWDYPTFLALAERGRFRQAGDVVGVWRKHGASGTLGLAGRDLAGTDLSLDLALATRRRVATRRDLPSEPRIRAAWADAFGRNAFQVGRVLLVNRQFADARDLALRGLGRARSVRLRLRLAAVLVAAVTHADLERILRVRGRSTLEELR